MKKLLSIICVVTLLASCNQKQNSIENQTQKLAMNSNNKKENKMSDLKAGKNSVTFTSFGVELAGDLYLPEGFDPSKKYKAIVSASPFPQVKEQVMATYGPEMAKRGFVFLGFDYLGMGDSPALPGEHKPARYSFRIMENTWDAVSYLGTLPFVEEILGLGVCQGGATIASVAVTDHRIKKIALVSGMMAADGFSWGNIEMAHQTIAAANASRQKMYETGEADLVPTFGMTDDQSREEFMELLGGANPLAGDSYDYYGRDGVFGPKAIKNFSNLTTGDQMMEALFSIGEHYADKIVQPTLVIYGKDTFTNMCSIGFIEKLTNEHEVLAVPGVQHLDFYYKPDAVKLSADAAAEFFNK